MNDHDREMVDDVTGEGGSNCCGASVYELGESFICKDCKEYCEIEKEEPQDKAFSREQLAFIEKSEKACSTAGCDGDGHKCS